PFALRRAANAIVSIIWNAGLPLNLHKVVSQVIETFAKGRDGVESAQLTGQITDFFSQRVRTLLQDGQGIDYDLVNAVFGQDAAYQRRALTDLLDVRDRATFLQTIRNNGQLAKVYETVNRASKLAAKGSLDTDSLDPEGLVTPSMLEQSSEKAFFESLQKLVPQTQVAQAERDYSKLLAGLEKIAPTVADFFDGPNSVLVMAEEDAVRENRLNLLSLLRNHARVLADFGEIVKG
ncbi:MAG: glycine--tRNA ligase subunit beta, partial [Cyanobacteria bacterium J06553_1]